MPTTTLLTSRGTGHRVRGVLLGRMTLSQGRNHPRQRQRKSHYRKPSGYELPPHFLPQFFWIDEFPKSLNYGLASISCWACRSSRISKSEYKSPFLSSACKSPTAVPGAAIARVPSGEGFRPASVRNKVTLSTIRTARE